MLTDASEPGHIVLQLSYLIPEGKESTRRHLYILSTPHQAVFGRDMQAAKPGQDLDGSIHDQWPLLDRASSDTCKAGSDSGIGTDIFWPCC